MKRTLLFASALLLTLSTKAQPYLDSFNIKDYAPNSSPASFITDDLGTTLYFSAQEPVYGREIWSFSPTDTFPTRLTDVNSGSTYSVQAGPDNMFYMNGTIYYAGIDTGRGVELFSYKPGQTATLVKDIDTGANRSSYPKMFSKMNGKLYFTARVQTSGYELWEYDPTSNTTRMVDELNPGSYDSNPRHLTPFNNKLYFQGNNTNTGTELYSYDPVTDTIQLVADIYPGNTNGDPVHLLVHNGKLYFSGTESAYGAELYEYDGTNAPTRITDIAPGADNGVYNPANLTVYNGKIFFSGYDATTSNFQLYSYDPANSATTLEATVNPSGGSNIRNLVVYGTKLFFAAAGNAQGLELWSFDGTTAKLEADVYPGTSSSNITELTVAGNSLFFSATNSTYGTELFRFSLYPLGIKNASVAIEECTLYPNPANDLAHLKIGLQKEETLSVAVTDMHGRVVYQTSSQLYSKGSHNVDIPLSKLPSGNYIYQLLNNEKMVATGKLTKQ